MKHIKYFKRWILNKGALLISLVKLWFLLFRMPKNPLIIDCGANQGDISLFFLKRGATVYAFEPDPLAFQILKKRTANYSNIEINQKAVGTNDGKINLFLHQERENQDRDDAYTVSSSIVKEKINVNSKNSVEVEIIDFIVYLNRFDKPIDLIKMDIEGAEIEILEKIIEKQIYNNFNLLVVETHENKIPSHIEKIQNIKKLIRENNINNIKLNWV